MVRALTGGLGADVVLEAVGTPAAFELCTTLVRPGGHVANIGVHGKPATLHLEELWIRNVTITTGLVDTHSTPTLLRMLAGGQLNLDEHARPTRIVFDRWGDPDRTGQWGWHPFGFEVTAHATFGGLTVPSAGRAGWFAGTAMWARGEFLRCTVSALQIVT